MYVCMYVCMYVYIYIYSNIRYIKYPTCSSYDSTFHDVTYLLNISLAPPKRSV